MQYKVNVIDPVVKLHSMSPDELVIKSEQYLPDDYVSELKRKVQPTMWASGENEVLFRIPVEVVAEMQRQGYDFYHMSDAEVARYLRVNHLDAFIVGRI